ncbi:hypothetical protein JKP88DRAFT_279151 [Tribonema minus]|uniref:Uncharacterized protein n=1 Tax=Tribonema minus TaxID=303371 RepID=A0A835YTY9_9STRA|nr:hypothetical protein JKP88DRAFT_279151 [Tribonema minus]
MAYRGIIDYFSRGGGTGGNAYGAPPSDPHRTQQFAPAEAPKVPLGAVADEAIAMHVFRQPEAAARLGGRGILQGSSHKGYADAGVISREGAVARQGSVASQRGSVWMEPRCLLTLQPATTGLTTEYRFK